MRLLMLDDSGAFRHTQDLVQPEPYAILSHTWGEDADEVTYQDIRDGTGQDKSGWEKFKFCAQRTKEAGLKYFWIDTCCIDKRNEAEVSYAIRSMFRWYANATVCFVYLSDVSIHKRSRDGEELWRDAFRTCRWFRRGWTLQELIAPKSVQFYARESRIGDRSTLSELIHEITNIEMSALQGRSLDGISHHTRLQWATQRLTKVPEDLAYCLIGLCGISMSPRYGEGGEDARRRLEGKITKRYGTAALEKDPRTLQAPDPKAHRGRMLEWLKFDAMDSRRTTIKKALTKTCGWILSEPTYTSWSQFPALQEHHGFFWIKGKPGAGKSVLMKFLENHMCNTKDKDDICISFYFNARGESLEQSFLGMYRSLLLQLLLAAPELQNVFDSVTKMPGEPGAMVETIQRMILNACLKLGKRRLYCFIDALDECQEQDVSRMIDFFQDLGQSAIDAGTSVFVCFASRHYPIFDIPTGLDLVLEDVEQHTRDLEMYARHHLRVGTAKQSEQVTRDILAKANGVFLWVVLVVEILKKDFRMGRIYAVKKRLDETPQGLTELFKQITLRDSDYVGELLLCLKWILYAKRPLNLIEFYFAMLAGFGDGELEWDPELVTEEQMHMFLLSTSKGLAELTRGAIAKVQFIHESVRDFLITEEGLKHIEYDGHHSRGWCHETLKQCCLRGLQEEAGACKQEMDLVNSQWRPSTSKVTRTKVTRRFPFLEYATTSVLYHSDHAAVEVPQLQFLKQLDVDDWLAKSNFLQKHDINLYKGPLDLIYLCAERDLANLITTLADHDADLTQDSGQRNENPVFAAFANKSPNAARVLLHRTGAKNADDIVKEVIVDNYKGRPGYDRLSTKSRLNWALENAYENLAVYLVSLAKPGKFPDRGECQKALLLAARSGFQNFMTAVLEQGLDANACEQGFCDALRAASYRDHGVIVKLLLDKYPDINKFDSLLDAIHRNSTEIVKLLIFHGANINADVNLYGTAIQTASLYGRTEALKLLLDNCADVNTDEVVYCTALQAASSGGHTQAVKLLLDSGAGVNAEGGEFGNALQAACANGQTEVMKLLLDSGADIEARGRNFGNALQAAAWHGHIQATKLLLDNGADVNAKGGNYGDALQAACVKGCKDVVKLLLDNGADVEASGGLYGNALVAASSRGHLVIAGWLLDKKVLCKKGDPTIVPGKEPCEDRNGNLEPTLVQSADT